MKKLIHLTTVLFIFIAASKGQAQDADRSYLPAEGDRFAAFGILNTGQFFYRKY